MPNFNRIFSLTLCVVFLWTPAADQLACFFCGPSPETSSTAKVVSHVEDDCILQDGFHREDPTSKTESIHVHFCTLHATFVALTDSPQLKPVQIFNWFRSSHEFFRSVDPTHLYHPPRHFSI